MKSFEQANAGQEFVITLYRSSAGNLRTQASRIVKRAGLQQLAACCGHVLLVSRANAQSTRP
jgi:hypothetical protein